MSSALYSPVCCLQTSETRVLHSPVSLSSLMQPRSCSFICIYLFITHSVGPAWKHFPPTIFLHTLHDASFSRTIRRRVICINTQLTEFAELLSLSPTLPGHGAYLSGGYGFIHLMLTGVHPLIHTNGSGWNCLTSRGPSTSPPSLPSFTILLCSWLWSLNLSSLSDFAFLASRLLTFLTSYQPIPLLTSNPCAAFSPPPFCPLIQQKFCLLQWQWPCFFKISSKSQTPRKISPEFAAAMYFLLDVNSIAGKLSQVHKEEHEEHGLDTDSRATTNT